MTKEKHNAYVRATARLKMIIDCLRHGLDSKVCDPIIYAALRDASRAKTGWSEIGDVIQDALADAVKYPEETDRIWAGHMCEDLARVYKDIKMMRMNRKYGRKWDPIRTIMSETQHEANEKANNALTRPVNIVMRGLSRRQEHSHLIGPMWRQKTAACGGPTIGNRFILQADLVDQIGEYDLFQISYLTGATDVAQVGYLSRYRDTTIRGFGAKPETALSWTRRQVVMRGTKALTK